MTRRLLLSYLTITVLVLAVLVLPLGLTFANHESDVLLAGIERDAHTVASLVEENLEAGTTPRIDALLEQYRGSGGRIVVVDIRGAPAWPTPRPSAKRRRTSPRALRSPPPWPGSARRVFGGPRRWGTA